MNHIINSLILYTLETGSFTWYVHLKHPALFGGSDNPFISLVTIASLICVCLPFLDVFLCVEFVDTSQWIVMRHNLIFLGMHFAIAKRT